jgi:hypothetical protein
MLRTTVDALLSGQILTCLEHYLYMIADGETWLYIGRSAHPVERVYEHLGFSWRGGRSPLGQAIARNLPQASTWQIQFLTLADCEPYVGEHETIDLESYHDPAHLDLAIEAAEQALLLHFHPLLNVLGNDSVDCLPLQYHSYPSTASSDSKLTQLLGLEQAED